MFSDTAITDHHSDTTIFQLRPHWVLIFWFIGLENRSDVPPVGVEPSTSCMDGKHLIHKARRSVINDTEVVNPPFIVPSLSLRFGDKM